MKTDDATPRLWKVDKEMVEGSGLYIVPSGEGGSIAEAYGDTIKEQKANAKLIVQAVNSHEELIALVRQAVKYLKGNKEKPHFVRYAEQALAKAGVKT